MNHFELGVWQRFHFYLYRFFASREVILRPVTHAAEDRGLDLNQPKLLFKLAGKMGFYETDLALFCDVSGFHYLYSCVLLILIKQQKWHLIQ